MTFREKYFSYSINSLNFIFFLALLLEILGNMCIVTACLSVYDVINFQINFIFLIKPFFHVTKKPGQNFEYLKFNESRYKQCGVTSSGFEIAIRRSNFSFRGSLWAKTFLLLEFFSSGKPRIFCLHFKLDNSLLSYSRKC